MVVAAQNILRCCGHICVGEALHLIRCVYCKRSHAAITRPEKKPCVALSLFLSGQGG